MFKQVRPPKSGLAKARQRTFPKQDRRKQEADLVFSTQPPLQFFAKQKFLIELGDSSIFHIKCYIFCFGPSRFWLSGASLERPHRLTVRTQAFQAWNPGSIPGGVMITKKPATQALFVHDPKHENNFSLVRESKRGTIFFVSKNRERGLPPSQTVALGSMTKRQVR